MDANRFRNIIASMFNIDRDDLEKAGLVERGILGNADWLGARDNPARWVMRLGDAKIEALWILVAARQKPDPLVEALREARAQIEYLHEKFQPTGSGNSILARIDAALGSE